MQDLKSYSYSRVKSFFNCPYYYQINYLIPEDERPEKLSHGTSEFGSFVHDILEKYGKGILKADELLDYYKQHYAENVVSDFTLYMTDTFHRDFSYKYYEDGLKFFENFKGIKDIKIVEAEHRFEMPYKNKFLINGKIDVVGLDKDNNLCIIDYKSKSRFKSSLERDDYAKQLFLYAWAFLEEMKDEKAWGKFQHDAGVCHINKDKVKLAFYMFRTDKWVWIEFTKEKMQEVLDWMEASIDEIEKAEYFEPNEDIQCGEFNFFCKNFCSFRNSCQYK